MPAYMPSDESDSWRARWQDADLPFCVVLCRFPLKKNIIKMKCLLCPGPPPPHILLDLWSCRRSCSCRQSCGSPPVELQGGRPPSTSTTWTWKLPNLPLILPTKMCRPSQWETKCIWSFSKSSLVYNYEKTSFDVSTDPFWGSRLWRSKAPSIIQICHHRPWNWWMWIFIASKHQRWEELHLIKGQSLPIKTKTSQREPAKYDTEILKASCLGSKRYEYVSHNNYTNFLSFYLGQNPITVTLICCRSFILILWPRLHLGKSNKDVALLQMQPKVRMEGICSGVKSSDRIVAKVKIEMDNRIIFRYRKMCQCRDTNVEIMMVTKKTIEMDWTDESLHGWMLNT